MIYILDNFLTVWYYWMFVSFGLGLLGFILIFYAKNEEKYYEKKFLIYGWILFGQVFITYFIGFGSLEIITTRARNEIKCIFSNQPLKVLLNNKELSKEETAEIIQDIRQLKEIQPHHSHTTEQFDFTFHFENTTVKLLLARDSDINDEYWVYWDKYITTSKNEIGRIKLDKIKNSG